MTEYSELVQNLKADPAEVAYRVYAAPEHGIDLLHGAIGLSTEAGEVLDILKKQVFYDKDIDRVHLIEELGDIEWYLQLIRDALDISRDEVIAKNMAKLKVRYGSVWTQEAAMNRDLEKEREVMENA